jgi:hypothetical protein
MIPTNCTIISAASAIVSRSSLQLDNNMALRQWAGCTIATTAEPMQCIGLLHARVLLRGCTTGLLYQMTIPDMAMALSVTTEPNASDGSPVQNNNL